MLKKLNTWKRNDKKIDEARKKLNDSVGLGRRDSIEYLAPGESGRAEDEAGVVRSEVVVKVQANNLGLGLILELAPHDGNVVIDIWEQGGISKFHNDIRPGDILAKVRKPSPSSKDPAGSIAGTRTSARCSARTTCSAVRADPLEFGVLRLSDSEERADTSQVQAATTGAL